MNLKSIIYIISSFFLFIATLSAQEIISNDSSCSNSIDFLKKNCYTCVKSDSLKCKVEEFGYIGKTNNRYYYYQISHRFDSNDIKMEDGTNYQEEINIFEGINSKEDVKSIYKREEEETLYYFYKPDLVDTKYGYILHINATGGNGGWDNGDYLILRNNNWFKLEMPDFMTSFNSIMPDSCYFCRGSSIDLKKFIIKFAVFRGNDPCCCPTGGQIIAKLKISIDNHIKIISAKYFPKLKEY
ncbi:MAG: hypothetical protein WCE54_07435 [Ignavibacteriaceae bacterium]